MRRLDEVPAGRIFSINSISAMASTYGTFSEPQSQQLVTAIIQSAKRSPAEWASLTLK